MFVLMRGSSQTERVLHELRCVQMSKHKLATAEGVSHCLVMSHLRAPNIPPERVRKFDLRLFEKRLEPLRLHCNQRGFRSD